MNIPARVFGILLIVLAASLISPPVHAQSPTRKPLLRPSKMMERMMNGEKGQKIQAVVERLFSKFENRAAQYEQFLERVQSRRDKLASSGKDTSKLDAFLTTAKGNLLLAKDAITEAKTVVDGLDYASENKKDVREKVMAEVKKVRAAMTTLHTSMSQTVRLLKSTQDVNKKGTSEE